MAGKLPPEQKALNKEAMKLRDAAFKERRNAYQSEMEAAEDAIKSGEIGKAADDAYAVMESLIDARNSAVSIIEKKIRLLQEEMARVTKEHGVIIDEAKAKRDATGSLKRNAIYEAREAVEAKYPDMANCFSAAAWKSIDEFLPLVKAKSAA